MEYSRLFASGFITRKCVAMDKNLLGKTPPVTGTASGMGRAVALLYVYQRWIRRPAPEAE